MFILFKLYGRRRSVVHFLALSAVATAPGFVDGSEFFTGVASNPEFLRDVQTAFVSGNQTAPASAGDGQNLTITLGQLGAGTDVWNNERNQVLAGIEYNVRRFENNLSLPEGFTLPVLLHRVSASLHYY